MGPYAAPARQPEMVRCRTLTKDVSHLPIGTQDGSGSCEGMGELCNLSLKTDPTDKAAVEPTPHGQIIHGVMVKGDPKHRRHAELFWVWQLC